MKCPICKKPVSLGEPFMPFCGERCKMIDLANWAEEKYVTSSPLSLNELADLDIPDEKSNR